MKWLRENLVMLISSVVAVALFGLIIWFQRQAAARNEAIQADLKEKIIKLQNIGQSKLFPSPENLKRLEENHKLLAKTYDDLRRTISQSLPVPDLDRVKFASFLAQKTTRLRQDAAEGNVKVPDNFAFGFDQWMVALPPAQKPVIVLLTKHLLAVEKLSETMFQSGIEEIRVIKPPDADLTAPREGSTKGSAAKPLYATYSFDLEFACSTPALRNFFRNLAESDWFFIVKTMTINVQQLEVAGTRRVDLGGPAGTPRGPGELPQPPMPGVPPPGFGFPPGAPPPNLGGGGIRETMPARPERAEMVKRNRLVVSLRVDLVEFLGSPAQPEKSAAAHAK